MEVIINYKDISLVVEGVYEEGEDAVMRYADGTGYDGCPSSFSAETIKIEDSNIDIISLLENDLEEIEEMCKNLIEK